MLSASSIFLLKFFKSCIHVGFSSGLLETLNTLLLRLFCTKSVSVFNHSAYMIPVQGFDLTYVTRILKKTIKFSNVTIPSNNTIYQKDVDVKFQLDYTQLLEISRRKSSI